MICPKCGLQLPKQACFCAACGYKMQSEKEKSINKNKVNQYVRVRMFVLILLIGILSIRYFGNKREPLEIKNKNIAQEMKNDAIEDDNTTDHTEEHKLVQISQQRMNVQQSDGYLYFKYITDLVRVPETGGELETVMTCNETVKIGSDTLLISFSTFAILDDEIYFGIRPIEMGEGYPTAYFRVSKNGGEAEFLFLLPESNLVVEGDTIYFLFEKSSAYGIYDPENDKLPLMTRLKAVPTCEGDERPAFSIKDGFLYYLGSQEKQSRVSNTSLYQIEVESGVSQVLLDSNKIVTDGIKNVIYAENEIYYSADLYNVATCVKKYSLETGTQSIIYGFQGKDDFIAADNEMLMVANSGNGTYIKFNKNTPEEQEAIYEGAVLEGFDDITESINSQLGITSDTELTDTTNEPERDKIEKYLDGYFIASGEMFIIDSGERFSWFHQQQRAESIKIDKENALRQAETLWLQSKESDSSVGISLDGTIGKINEARD